MAKTANKLICWKEARVRALWVRAQKAHNDLAAAKAAYEEIKSEMSECLGDKNELWLDGRPILVKQTIQRKEVFDYATFALDHPRLATQYWTTPASYERLDFKW
jgi:hypothetical protein